MGRKTIAVDIDEVLFPFVDEFIKYHNNRFLTSLRKDQFHTYEFSKPLNLGISETVERIYAFFKQLDSNAIKPFEESKKAIAKLLKYYDLAVVTARHPQFEAISIKWLKEHYGNSFADITHIGYAPIMEKPKTKAEVCLEIGAVALIDDSIDHVLQCSELDIEGILFGDYPWNQVSSLPSNVIRCPDWQNVLQHFNL